MTRDHDITFPPLTTLGQTQHLTNLCHTYPTITLQAYQRPTSPHTTVRPDPLTKDNPTYLQPKMGWAYCLTILPLSTLAPYKLTIDQDITFPPFRWSLEGTGLLLGEVRVLVEARRGTLGTCGTWLKHGALDLS